jgi:hypothetical protein
MEMVQMMKRRDTRILLKRLLLAMVMVMPLAGCLSLEEDTDSAGPAAVSTTSTATDVLIAGSVGDGPVTGATITVYTNDGEVLGSVVSDDAATFRSTFKVRGNEYPLRLTVSDGIDLVTGTAPDFEMVSVMLKPSDKRVNINPFTTLIVLQAENMPGGLNSDNVDAAHRTVLEKLGFGLDSSIIADPITTEITDENVAHLVKSSEALGEMVRRTRDLIAATGKVASGDSIMKALAADLVDGFVDGFGAAGASPIVASVANVVSGQVLVEAMSNSLRVNGVVATSVIDQSILTTHTGTGSVQLTGSVSVTAQMLDQTSVAVAAAQVLDPGEALMDVAAGLASLTPGSSPDEVMDVLPEGSESAFDNAVYQVATASDDTVTGINQVVVSGDTYVSSPPPPSNTPPVIAGAPAGSVTAGESYVFQPAASDSDGDTLSFTIANKPSWAGFNPGTGRLSGTPADSDAGSYGGIVIAVSDGTDTTSLAAFSIQVNAAPVANTAPVISGAPSTSVTAASTYQFQPTATDADGDALTFSISNKPSWASFNPDTGRLSGTPADPDAGSYGGIVIAVTDGTDTASLAAFSIQVNPAPVQTGSMSLSWVAPTSRADGTAMSLSDIDRYRIFYGTSAGSYPNSIDVTDGSATSATITSLPAGTYYVVMSTVDVNGLESTKSTPVTKDAR